MRVYAKNNTLVCEPYELKNQSSSSLFVSIDNSDNIAKIIDLDDSINNDYGYNRNDIIIYDNTKYVKECVLCGKKYIMIPKCNVFAIIKEDE